ncbi:unnamed protein product [Moneuplotes crassus]|uniref:Uncharacterized protein n=1 Tax=Euplotes crassus TaxID=5936 RepID=A0AAD1XXV1_EUPCR|nr:unnamed protein product [Moneuplotes crassus]
MEGVLNDLVNWGNKVDEEKKEIKEYLQNIKDNVEPKVGQLQQCQNSCVQQIKKNSKTIKDVLQEVDLARRLRGTAVSRMDKLSEDINSLASQVHRRMDTLDDRVRKVEERLSALEWSTDALESKVTEGFNKMTEGFNRMEHQIDQLAKMTANKFQGNS